jgi:hypothetical protein
MSQSSYAELVTINFDDLAYLNNHDPIPSTYGSTPTLAVSYRSLYSDSSPRSNYLTFWGDPGYANLSNVAISEQFNGVAEITFEAVGAANLVTLDSFQLGAWGPGDSTANLLRVLDGNGDELFNAAPALIDSTTAVSFLPNVSASKLVLQWGYTFNIGIDNIVVNAVPLPGAAVLAVLGLGVAGHRLRKCV